jgi:hypothetical protein
MIRKLSVLAMTGTAATLVTTAGLTSPAAASSLPVLRVGGCGTATGYVRPHRKIAIDLSCDGSAFLSARSWSLWTHRVAHGTGRLYWRWCWSPRCGGWRTTSRPASLDLYRVRGNSFTRVKFTYRVHSRTHTAYASYHSGSSVFWQPGKIKGIG